MIIVTQIHRSDLVIESKETALEFYKGIKHCILIPSTPSLLIRVEPGNLIGFISEEEAQNGKARFIPNFRDDDGSIAYRHRRYINAYLRKDD